MASLMVHVILEIVWSACDSGDRVGDELQMQRRCSRAPIMVCQLRVSGEQGL